jgi:hypothetical protein
VLRGPPSQLLTLDEREQAKAKIQPKLGRASKFNARLRDLAERVVDPIKMTVTFLPEIGRRGTLYGCCPKHSLPLLPPFHFCWNARGCCRPLQQQFYDNIMLEYPDIDPDKLPHSSPPSPRPSKQGWSA